MYNDIEPFRTAWKPNQPIIPQNSYLRGLFSELKPLVQEIGDATLIVPLIKEYLDISVKNDEQLIKMATIVQRALNNSSSEDALGITEEEKNQLMEELDKLNENFEEKKDGK